MEMGRDRHLTENLLELASCFRGRTHRGLTFLFRRFFFFFSNLRQNSVLVCQGKPLDRLRKKKCFLIVFYWNCLTFSMSTARFLAKCHTFLEMSRFSKHMSRFSFLVSRFSFLVSRFSQGLVSRFPRMSFFFVSNEMHVVCHAVTLVSHISLDTNFLLWDVSRLSKDVFSFQRRISCFFASIRYVP